eukprot:CAMPEP_0202872580 /NCGR_PEP_ID=MMETSP1391-20130828/21552_1 /ASSEMBLY_ACC=CAM_ASM_000867 /TAXON_ID=1034604 /ORGANISM="Chlamydomonas leiostraca, Strain SAG 11-49" /LENGTH=30 /DNA_ID= /DNA_START= /DNA_END= /DNA_ORIENTATION=
MALAAQAAPQPLAACGLTRRCLPPMFCSLN